MTDRVKGSNHTRSVEVDLTLLDATGQKLDMCTPVDTTASPRTTLMQRCLRPCRPMRSFFNASKLFRRYLQVTHNGRPVEHGQLAHGHRFDVDPSLDTPAFTQALRVFAFGAWDHSTYGNAARHYRRASPIAASDFVFVSNELIGFR